MSGAGGGGGGGVLKLFYSLQRGSNGLSMVLFHRKLYLSKDSEGLQHFLVGVQLFPRGGGGGSIETHITCDFPG